MKKFHKINKQKFTQLFNSTACSAYKNKLIFECSFIVLLIICLVSIQHSRLLIYFRDYAIVFEGAHRMSLGQVPMKDFGTPVGPLVFLMPGIFFKYFGATWNNLLFSQLLQSIVILVTQWLILRRLPINTFVRSLAVLIFLILFVVPLSHPWYNITGLLVLQLAFYFSMSTSRYSIMLAGFFAGLTVFTKQDFGAAAILLTTAMVMKFGVYGSTQAVYNSSKINLHLSSRLVQVFFLYLLFLALTVIISIYFLGSENFFYWFNYGQDYQAARSLKITDLIILSFMLLATSLWFNNFILFVAGFFVLASGITASMSGLGFTSNYFVGFFAVALNEMWKLKHNLRWLLFVFALPMVYKMYSTSKNVFFIAEAIYLDKPEHFFFNYREIFTELQQPRGLDAFGDTIMMPTETIDIIKELKLYSQMQALKGEPFDVLNISELTPIYAELNIKPPSGLPLWFHSHVSMFDQEIDDLSKLLSLDRFDVVLIQATHENPAYVYQNYYKIINNNPYYRLYKIIKDTPATAGRNCKDMCGGEIYIYIKLKFLNYLN